MDRETVLYIVDHDLPNDFACAHERDRFGGAIEREGRGDVRLELAGRIPLPSWETLAANAAGSRRRKSPQNTPTIEQPFNSVRLSGIFGISPAAKPTTSRRPRHAQDRSAGSVYGPPTGSTTTSTPRSLVSVLIRSRRFSEL